MRRALLTLLALAGVVGAACTAFDFPPPGATAADAGPDSIPPADAASEAGSQSYLGTDDAARVCSLLFQCPRLAEAIELSMALPVDTPSSPLSFSGCMDWVAGPIDPGRIGLPEQRSILAAVAAATTCDAAGAALPVRPADAGTACGLSCADTTDLASCTPEGGTFLLPCSSPYFAAQGATCLSNDAGLAGCVTAGTCQSGLSCADTNTLRECVAPTIEAYASYDCTLTGRQCATLSKNALADCVVPTHNTAPCPLHDRRDSCDGTAVLHCAGGLLAQTEFDCSAAGRACSESNKAGVARCVGSSDACSPFDDGQNACTGAKIQLCIGGSPVSYDCAGIGKTCVAGDAGQTGHCG